MYTQIQNINLDETLIEQLLKAKDYLTDNNIVAFPTETVYGLGANGLSEEAVAKIFEAKGRPQDNPLILHISSLEMLKDLAICNDDVFKLAKEFWPGPLTLVLPKKENVPLAVTAGLETVAIRMPSHPIALKLIELCNFPLAAPSANRSGRPSPTSARMVYHDLRTLIPLILDGGACDIGLESTVLDLSSPTPKILRPGQISPQQIQPFLANLADYQGLPKSKRPSAPGMKYKHYKPNVKIILLKDLNKIEDLLTKEDSLKPAFIGLNNPKSKNDSLKKLIFQNPGDLAKNLYSLFFKLEQSLFDLIIIEDIQDKEIGLALMNRILKAADRIVE